MPDYTPPPPRIHELVVPIDIHAEARVLYDAYVDNASGLNYQGNACPTWPELTPSVRSHWCRVAAEARRMRGELTEAAFAALIAESSPWAPMPKR